MFVEEVTQRYHTKNIETRGVIGCEIESIVGPIDGDERDESEHNSEDTDEVGDCPQPDCDGVLIDMFDVSAYLGHNDPPPDVADRMEIAKDWRIGRIEPPPGLKHPQLEAEARKAFDAITGD